ncbi:fasciclin domain-containing protein [Sphingomicrobium aestuariivivum]|uniref:fasciclin domain-containing protein n=1 Tax=Sphingomicrobium aestuariivivum TaxID=1582356 RepID=UPI001FD6422B|nr:fasciclin domain-containing protein [Sphingomicrobium aestuariivivum]MCJ8191217.1 fasciclin domain-containing protein [Sphingomicrobium aestuariivivum]
MIGGIARAALIALPLTLAACGNDGATEEAVSDVSADPETLAGAIPADSRFAEALGAAGLDGLFEGPEPYTVLLPADDAFPATLPEDKEELAALVTLHILPGTILGEDIASAFDQAEGGELTLPTYGGSDLVVTRSEGGFMVAPASGGEAVALTPGDGPLEDGAVHRVGGLLGG